MFNNLWYDDTMRLERAGYRQIEILTRHSPPGRVRNVYRRIKKLRQLGIPREVVGIYPREDTDYALYVKTTGLIHKIKLWIISSLLNKSE